MAKARTSNSCNGIRGVHAVQVVLPLLDSAVVEPGWISEPDFLTGIALVQAMPGPLFNIAAYVGNRSTLRCRLSNCSMWFVFTDLSSWYCCFCAAAALLLLQFNVHNLDCSSALTNMPYVHDWKA